MSIVSSLSPASIILGIAVYMIMGFVTAKWISKIGNWIFNKMFPTEYVFQLGFQFKIFFLWWLEWLFIIFLVVVFVTTTLKRLFSPLLKDALAFIKDPEARIASGHHYPSGRPMSVRDARKQGLL